MKGNDGPLKEDYKATVHRMDVLNKDTISNSSETALVYMNSSNQNSTTATYSCCDDATEDGNQLRRRRLLSFSSQICLGDFVDAQDSTGKWYEAVVVNVTKDTVKVHYCGWSSKWDCTIFRRRTFSESGQPIHIPQCSKIAGPPQALWSHTRNWREEVQIDDEIEVRESTSDLQRPRWLRATVRAISSQKEAVEETTGGAELEQFVDIQNGGKQKRPLLLLGRTQQVLVEVSGERVEFPSIDVGKKFSSSVSTIDVQPPVIRWVYLYGEEICDRNTHIKNHVVDNISTSIIEKDNSGDKKTLQVVLPNLNHKAKVDFMQKFVKSVPPTRGSVGFHNLGNSCYMNSILQCLNRIEDLTNYFLRGKHLEDINEDNPLSSGGRIAKSYAALLGDVWSGEYSILAPQELKGTIGKFAPQFNNFHQHDSQEFCSFLLDSLHEDLNRVKDKPFVEDVEGWGMNDNTVALESWRKHLSRNDSVIIDSYQGMHRSHLICLLCRKESVKFDVYSILSLSLLPSEDGKPLSINDCLEQFTMGEQLDENNAWFCPKCNKNVQSSKMMKLWSTPDILILHLKRFTFDKCSKQGGLVRSKIETIVDFPIDTSLDMAPYIQGPIDPTAPPHYKLFAVSEHSGSTPNSGHYTATVHNSRDGKWYHYNDSHVSVTSGDMVVTGGAYLLFYKREKGVLKWAGLEGALNNTVITATSQKTLNVDEFTEVITRRKKK